MASPKRRNTDVLSFRQFTPASLMLLAGKEDYSASWVWQRVREQLRAQDPDIQIHQLDAPSYEAGQLTMLTAPSLFGGANAIYVDSLEKMNDAFLTDALDLLSGPEPDAVLVYRHRGGNRGKRLLDALKKKASVVECPEIKSERDKTELVRRIFADEKRRISPEAATVLVSALGNSVAELAAGAEQLINIVTGDVGVDAVEQYYGGRVEVATFKVADAALGGQITSALELNRHCLETGTPPLLVVAALAAKARQIALISDGAYSSQSAAAKLGLPPWQAEHAARSARHWDGRRIGRALELIAHADHQVKGLSRDAEYACEQVVLKVSQLAVGRDV
ncbi:DNA polymerase III subunit delta [Micrococcoides hystricis]|uniref:DNA-directed DNA polymerase n=1 Tax=Micrococcoides hystricis TaxID=1572761 RepID=A0ABV6P7L5_9MICC